MLGVVVDGPPGKPDNRGDTGSCCEAAPPPTTPPVEAEEAGKVGSTSGDVMEVVCGPPPSESGG